MYLVDTAETATTVQDTALAIYTSLAGCAGPLTLFTGNDEAVTTGTTFIIFKHKARILVSLTAGTTYYILVSKFGTGAPNVGESTVQLRISEGSATATPTNTGIPGGTPGTPFPTASPTAQPFTDAIYVYSKGNGPSPFSGDTTIHVRNTTLGQPFPANISGCSFTFPPDNECDDDEGNTYGVPPLNLPPSNGNSALNTVLAGVVPRPDDFRSSTASAPRRSWASTTLSSTGPTARPAT